MTGTGQRNMESVHFDSMLRNSIFQFLYYPDRGTIESMIMNGCGRLDTNMYFPTFPPFPIALVIYPDKADPRAFIRNSSSAGTESVVFLSTQRMLIVNTLCLIIYIIYPSRSDRTSQSRNQLQTLLQRRNNPFIKPLLKPPLLSSHRSITPQTPHHRPR